MTKAQIEALISTITIGGTNTASEAVAIWEGLKNELYPTEYNAVLENNPSGLSYDLYFSKRGNMTHLRGRVYNITNLPYTATILINSEYAARNGTHVGYSGTTEMTIQNNNQILVTIIPATTQKWFSFNYINND
jgi:hypothetical protein